MVEKLSDKKQRELFRSLLTGMINKGTPLVLLSDSIDC